MQTSLGGMCGRVRNSLGDRGTGPREPRVPAREAACQKFATSTPEPGDVWQALALLSASRYEPYASLTQRYASDP